jgi:hypothetical protein
VEKRVVKLRKGGNMKRLRQTIKAGKRGTTKYVDKYGPDLLYVRYYYDWEKRKRTTTVELVLDRKKWEPKKIPPKTKVKLKVGREEIGIQKKIKEKGENGIGKRMFGKLNLEV